MLRMYCLSVGLVAGDVQAPALVWHGRGLHGGPVDGAYVMECSTFNIPTLFCGCSYGDPDDPPDDPPDEPFPATPSVSITFSAPAVIFEDRYEASPDNWVEKRSTTNTLTVTAFGGASGATLILSTANLECLQRVGGSSVSLPVEIVLGPYMSYAATFQCQGAGDGGTASVSGIISGLDGTDSSSAQTSVVRVEIQSCHTAPENEKLNRHDFGIGELMYLFQVPASPVITVSATDAEIRGAVARTITWGILDVDHSFSLTLSGVEYVPLLSIKRPVGIEGYDAQASTNGLPIGVAGGIRLVQRYKVLPLDVDFSALEIEEVPCYDPIPPTGYFIYTLPEDFPRTHSSEAGAGNSWLPVGSGNRAAVRDYAGTREALPRRMPDGTETTNTAYGWLGGTMTWKVPFGWRGKSDRSVTDPIGRFAEDVRQIMSITESGDFGVQKLGHEAIRRIDGTITLDGNADDGILDN